MKIKKLQTKKVLTKGFGDYLSPSKKPLGPSKPTKTKRYRVPIWKTRDPRTFA